MGVIFLNNPDFQRALYVQYHVMTKEISSKMT